MLTAALIACLIVLNFPRAYAAQNTHAYSLNDQLDHVSISSEGTIIENRYDNNGNLLHSSTLGASSSKNMWNVLTGSNGSFETDNNYDGIADGWIVDGSPGSSLAQEATYGDKSQQLEIQNGLGAIRKSIGTISDGRYFLVLVDYKSSSTSYESLRVNETGTNWGLKR
jgi:hypothetical protein